MKDILALFLLLVLLFGCETKYRYRIDGVPHTLVLNPSDDGGER